MINLSKTLFKEIEEDIYGFYMAHWVLYTGFEELNIEKPDKNIPNEISLHIYFTAKTPSDLDRYGKIVESKIIQEIGDNNDGSNKTTVAYNDNKLYYNVIANEVDYNSQEILQQDFSIKEYIKNSDLYSLARKNYLHYYSNILRQMVKIGIYSDKSEFQDHYFEDMVKAAGEQKESVLKEDISPDKYCFQVRTISIHEISADHENFADYSIRFAAKDAYAGGRYEEIIKEKISKEFNISEKSGEERASIFCAWPNYFYSVMVEETNFDDQDILQEDYSIRDHIKNNYLNGKSIDRDKYNVPFKLTMGGLYTDKLLDIIEFGAYEKEEDFRNNYFEDMVKLSGLEQSVEECCCAGGIGGGVTTASFAPAVTNTVYPKPNKKKKTKKESDETIDEIYGYYSCIVRIHLDFSGYSDNKVVKYYAVLAKTIDKIDEYNKKINENIKKISDKSCITNTSLSGFLYSTEIKNFDFDGQKFLDSSLYTNDRMKFFQSEKILDEESRENHRIINDSFTNLSDFVDDLFVKLTEDTKPDFTIDDLVDFTDNLFSQMTEDADDVYWPVRNDETDAFEKKISDERQAKKDKIIARKEKVIKAREESLDRWLDFMTSKGVSLVVLKKEYDKAIKKIYKLKEDLRRIKSLPLTSPEFLSRNI